MATAWPVATYPLADKTAFRFQGNTSLDYMTDGTVRLREVTSTVPASISVRLAPLGDTESEAFENYVWANIATEFEFTLSGATYTGYIDSRTLRHSMRHGVVHFWSFTLLSVRT